MARKKVTWTETAARQRNSILQYWAEHNKSNSYSLKLLELSNLKTKLIVKNPELFRLSKYPNTRVASMGHFSIHYKVDKNDIIITLSGTIGRILKCCLKFCKKKSSN